jgi:galactose mutarotase-like enzyme
MTSSTAQSSTRQCEGFLVYVLRTAAVEVAVVPELGAKIISLKNLRTQREWLWRPKDKLELFKNSPQDDFSASTLVGIDECLPTIAPCSWRGRQQPDHGEVWSRPWVVEPSAWQQGIIKTSIKLENSPLEFERTLQLREDHLQFDYKLLNLSAMEERFIWAIHPLLRLTEGDQLELPASTRALFNGEGWIDAVASATPQNKCCKTFAHPVRDGTAAIKNNVQGDRLQFTWDAGANNTLGLWLTRGGWHGHHHFAIEPTNANHDSLAAAAGLQRCGVIAGSGSTGWQLSVRVGP